YPADPARAPLPAHSDALKPEDLTDDDVVILTAPTAARRWAHIQVPVRAVVAIGQPTRRVAQQAAIELAATAASPDTAGLAAAVDRLRILRDLRSYHRPRRLRQSTALCILMELHRLAPAVLLLLVFVKEGADLPIDISSVPGVQQHSMDSLQVAARDA